VKRRTAFRIIIYGTLAVALLCVAWVRNRQPKPLFVHFRMEDYELKVIRCAPGMESLSDVKAAYGKRLEWAMNGGIFDPNFAPVGHLVIEGSQLSEINRADGEGNFYLKPNGVFYVDEYSARILPTEEYDFGKIRPTTAIQSGPLLIKDGSIHPALNPSSRSRYTRNGIGITRDGRICFGFFETPCSLHQMAMAFLKEGCESALYLDGAISGIVRGDREINADRKFSTFVILLNAQN
jgi:uncharacterized protein YigE (DUF2233 family)